MICVKCGYCCICYEVAILKDARKGNSAKNIKIKKTGDICQHLRAVKSKDGYKAKCAIHHLKNYRDTPCDRHTQVGKCSDVCRIGEYIDKCLKNKVKGHVIVNMLQEKLKSI